MRSHSPFRYQDELLMCLSAEDNVQSQTALCPSPKECPQSDERAYLRCILTEFCADKEVQL